MKMSAATFTSLQRFSAQRTGILQNVTIGIVKELESENRVAITPDGLKEIVLSGHKVYVQAGAGAQAGFLDQDYERAGATLMNAPADVYSKSQIIIKVWQPTPQEYNYIQPQQIIFCFVDKTANFSKNMMQREAVVINYYNIYNWNTFPVMSEITGLLAVQQGMKYMETQMGGSGKLLGSVSGVEAARVLILGGGVCAYHASMLASNMGAHVTVMDVSRENLRYILQQFPNVYTMMYNTKNLEEQLINTDLLIGATFVDGLQSSMLVNKAQMQLMRPQSVVVDLAMEFGGVFETSQQTTWENPIFKWNNITHFCVRNITCCVPKSSSEALNNSILPYALQVANLGWKRAAVETADILHGIWIAEKHFTNERFAGIFNLNFTPIENLLEHDISEAMQKSNNAWNLKEQLNMLNNQFSTKFFVEA